MCFSFVFSPILCCYNQQNKCNAHIEVQKIHIQQLSVTKKSGHMVGKDFASEIRNTAANTGL